MDSVNLGRLCEIRSRRAGGNGRKIFSGRGSRFFSALPEITKEGYRQLFSGKCNDSLSKCLCR